MNKRHCTSLMKSLLMKRLFLSRAGAPSPVPRRLAVAIGVACGLCWSAAARAEFKGTPGKVASIGRPENHCPLRIWEPSDGREVVVEPQTWSLNSSDSFTNGFPSPPAWSPDGTRLAYTKEIRDFTMEGIEYRHTSIRIYQLNSSTSPPSTQLTHPDPTRVPCLLCARWPVRATHSHGTQTRMLEGTYEL
jgi:hypothetical protein